MKIKVFVDWHKQEIINETEYKERNRQEVEKRTADVDAFYNWLNRNYNARIIWEMTEAQRDEIPEFWKCRCEDTAKRETTFEMVEIEV